jgi:ribonuclease HI
MINYECYTDGAYSPARDQGGVGVVYIRNGIKLFEYSKGFKKTTNNRMEILAVLVVLRSIKSKIDTLTIYTDSMYVIGCATLGWKRNKNLAMWNMFDSELARVSKLCPNIQFQHVKGHSNNQWNNYVDKLAVNASQELL